MIGMAVRAGAPKPDLSSAEGLKRVIQQAKSIGYSASVSGEYVTKELFQRLGVADEALAKSRFIGGGERVGAVIARGEVEIGFQQMSELLPVPGIAHITPLPAEVQKVAAAHRSSSATLLRQTLPPAMLTQINVSRGSCSGTAACFGITARGQVPPS